MKSGIKTTEFWLVLVGNLLTFVTAMYGYLDPKFASIIFAVLTGVYAALRTLVKNPEITTVVKTGGVK